MSSLDNPLLNGLALGLSFQDDGQVLPQSGLYPCCQGSGGAWDEALAGYKTCTLKTRLRRVQQLFAQFRRVWPDAARGPQQLSPQIGAQILQELAAVLRRDQAPATLSVVNARQPQSQSPSLLWSKALASIWRFGVETRIFHLQDRDARSLSQFTAETRGPSAWFLEGVDKLWDPALAETFEYIVQRAYNAEAFIWIDLHVESGSRQLLDSPEDNSLRANLSRRIAKLRQKHPLDCISRDCLSRLQSLAGGPLRMNEGDAQNA